MKFFSLLAVILASACNATYFSSPIKIVQTQHKNEFVYFPQSLNLLGDKVLLSFQTQEDALHPKGWTGRHFVAPLSSIKNFTEIETIWMEPAENWLVKPCVQHKNNSYFCFTYDTRRFRRYEARYAWIRVVEFVVESKGVYAQKVFNATVDMGMSWRHWPALWGNQSETSPYYSNVLVTDGNILNLEDSFGEFLFTTLYGYYEQDSKAAIIAGIQSRDNGVSWRFKSTVARAHGFSFCSIPSENHMIKLQNGSLLLVFRNGGELQHLCYTLSHDNGESWNVAKPLITHEPAPGSNVSWIWGVEPKLVTLSSGTIVLSTGRPGIMIWVTDQKLSSWKSFNIAEAHNFNAPPSFRYSSIFPSVQETTSYTGLIALPQKNSILISYDFLANGWNPSSPQNASAIFVMEVSLD